MSAEPGVRSRYHPPTREDMKLPIIPFGAFMGFTSIAAPAKRDAFSGEALSLHNTNRAYYGASPLRYDINLASSAATYGEQCHWGHSGGNYGENIYAASGSATSIQDAVNAWMNEASKYDYNHPGFSEQTGHFTQVVWKNTAAVGCAAHFCTSGSPFGTLNDGQWIYILCQYTPAGNVQGQFAANVERPQ